MRSIVPLFALAFAAAAPAIASETVSVPRFRQVELRGGGNVVVRPGPVQRVILVEGSTQFTSIRVEREGRLRIDTCNERCPDHYRMRVEIQTPDIPDLAIQGGGAIGVAPGFGAGDLSAAVNGGGKIDARNVDAGSVSAAVNGGGDITVRARSTLSAAINGGGIVHYLGNPQVSSAIHGGGLVRAAN